VFSKVSFVISRVIEFILIFEGFVLFFRDSQEKVIGLAIWDFFALIYAIIRLYRIGQSRKHIDSEDAAWLKGTLGRRIGGIFTLLTSVIGIWSGVEIVDTKGQGDFGLAAAVFAVPAVLLAWAILHFGYAERYAQAYYADVKNPVLVFPNVTYPNFADFTYFSFTLGTTFSVSDVETQTSTIRMRILAHSIISFIYNTATIAIVVGLLTG
jgi:uncharacterized membrane protein